MGLFDTDTGTYNPTAYALDTQAASAGEKSVFDSLGDVITKGLPLTGLAALNSFANTAIDIGNFFGRKDDRLSMEDELSDSDTADYYKAHQQGIEAAALVGGSIIPGGAAIKALKLLQAGRPTGTLARATWAMFSGPKQAIIDNAMTELAGSGGIYGGLGADKIKAIALGFGDQALQSLVYETATVATMKASPLLDQDGFNDTVNNMFYGTILGAGVGGVLEGIGTRAILNKALLNADTAAKAQQIATYLGDKGGFIAGDRVVALLDSIDNIPTPVNKLQSKHFAGTYDAALLNSKKILGTLIEAGDEDLTNGFMDTLLRMSGKLNDPTGKLSQAAMTKEEMYGYLSRLDSIQRIGTPPTAEDLQILKDGTFYANRFAPVSKGGSVPDWDSLMTTSPATTADTSLRYKLKEFVMQPSIASIGDTIEFNGKSVASYGTAEQAFADGHDVFIGKNNRIFVNPDAPNIERVARSGESRILSPQEEAVYRSTGKLPAGSAPLRGAPITLNLLDGSVASSAEPVVGDFSQGAPKLTDVGLSYGSKGSPRTSLQSINSVLTADTPTIDANARYVWASLRGIQRGDTIGTTDIPMLEQLYREATTSGTDFQAAMRKIEQRGVTFSDGSPLPQSANDLLGRIRNAKDQLIGDSINGDAKLTSEAAALRANVPEDYIANGLKGKDVKDFMIDPEQHMQVNHVQLSYNIGDVSTPDGQILKGMSDVQYRIQVIKDAQQAAHAQFFGADKDKFLFRGTSSDANILGAGPKLFSAANAAYNSLAQEAERIGRSVTTFIQGRNAANSTILAPSFNVLRDDPKVANEIGNFIYIRQKTGAKYAFLPPDIAAAEGVSPNIAVLNDSLKKDKFGKIVEWDRDYTPDGFVNGDTAKASAASAPMIGTRTYYELSDAAANFERSNLQINNGRIVAGNNFMAANGINRQLPLDTLYAPPIDTKKFPYFALIRAREGTGMADSGVQMVVGSDAAQLEQKIAALRDEYSVYTKDMIKTHHEVLGDYEYGRNFAQSNVDNLLQRKGILNDIFPDSRGDTIADNYINWHSRQESRLARDYVELGNAQLFAELKAMGQRFTSAETSRIGTIFQSGKETYNPYDNYIKTSLGINHSDIYGLWSNDNIAIEAFFDKAFSAAARGFKAARAGIISYEEAAAESEKLGLLNPYSKALDPIDAYYNIANRMPDQRYLSKFVSAANSVLSATAIRLDAFQSLINAVSTPVLLLAEANSAKQFLTTELPDGSGRSIPSISKVLFGGVASFVQRDSDFAKVAPILKDIGAMRAKSSEYFQLIDNVTFPKGRLLPAQVEERISNAVDLGGKLTGSELSEEFGRYIAGYTAFKIFGPEGAGYAGTQLTDNISTFVNRVHGNYVASQRPIAFQGPVGQAIGLFQTYQFNLMQQLFRYVENGEVKSLAILGGLQSTLFGLQGLPGFQAINNHIIGNAANNPAHKDIYSTTPNLLDKKLGDYLLYGVTSNWMNTGLYSRGDINPRQITILPTDPLDFPAIAGGIKLAGALLDTSYKIAQGGNIPASLMIGLEHNGLSRPLTGLAQLAQGFVTTSAGSLVAAIPGAPAVDNTGGLNDLISAANFSRLLGARPLDEAITMDAMYRKTLYMAKDTQRIGDLGEAVKSTLYAGGQPTVDQIQKFTGEYTAAGGHIQEFGKAMIKWSQDANISVANEIYKSLRNPTNQQMMQIMGGIKLPDFTSRGSTAASQVSGARQAGDGNYYAPDPNNPGGWARVGVTQ